jgi:hypothetical protein
MPRETQHGYLSGVLQRGVRIVRASDPNRRTPFRLDQNRGAPVSPVAPWEVETFSNAPEKEFHVLEVRPAPSREIQSSASNPSLPSSDTANASQKLDAGQIETGPSTHSIETNPSSPPPSGSVRGNFPSQPVPAQQTTRAAAESSQQISGAAEPAFGKASTVDRPPQVVEPIARQGAARAERSGAFESLGEKRQEAMSSESKGPPSFRIRDGFLPPRSLLHERTIESANLEANVFTRAAEVNSSVKSQPGPSCEPLSVQFGKSQQAAAAKQRARDESSVPRTNSQNLVAESREARPKKDATSHESVLAPPAEDLGQVFVQPISVPRFAEAGASQRAVNANPISPEAPKLTINRLDIQIIDQTPQPSIVAPTRQVARSDGGENIDRYQLGHIHLI